SSSQEFARRRAGLPAMWVHIARLRARCHILSVKCSEAGQCPSRPEVPVPGEKKFFFAPAVSRWECPAGSPTVALERGGFSPRGGGAMRRLPTWLRSEKGQGMSEYLIIVALVAIAAIGVVTVFGRDIRELFSGTTDSLAGNQASNTAVKAN